MTKAPRPVHCATHALAAVDACEGQDPADETNKGIGDEVQQFSARNPASGG
ncbi:MULTISPECIES: hypothetical protein [unclassified Meridianimarinicoccus]|uniref:hypothetical protein n=1 Tax=unclassified Meridianimarinicoccus TaxID=2923344 RepID=UPI0018668410|nr:hypothetical protein [Fluviibacterium sp. MJW13]